MKTEKQSAIEIEESYGEKPVKKEAQGLLNSAGITSPSLASLCWSFVVTCGSNKSEHWL